MNSITISDLIKQNAHNLIKGYGNEDSCKDFYENLLVVSSTLALLTDLDIQCDETNSLYRHKVLFDLFNMADFEGGKSRLDARLIRNNKIAIPKKHRELEIMADFYLAVQMSADYDVLKLFGFIPLDRITFDKEDEEFYYVDITDLLPIERLPVLMGKITPQKYHEYLDREEMHQAFIDLSYGEENPDFLKRIIHTVLATKDAYLEELDDFFCFDFNAKLLGRIPELLTDNSLDVFTQKIPFESEEITIPAVEDKDDDDRHADEEFGEIVEMSKTNNFDDIDTETLYEEVNENIDLGQSQDLLNDLNEEVVITEESVEFYRPMGAVDDEPLEELKEEPVEFYRPMGAVDDEPLEELKEEPVEFYRPMGAVDDEPLEELKEEPVEFYRPMGAVDDEPLEELKEEPVEFYRPMGAVDDEPKNSDNDMFASAMELDELFGSDDQIETINVKNSNKKLFSKDEIHDPETLGIDYYEEEPDEKPPFPHQKTMVVAALAGILIGSGIVLNRKMVADEDLALVSNINNVQDVSKSADTPDITGEDISYDFGEEILPSKTQLSNNSLPDLPPVNSAPVVQRPSSNMDEAISSAFFQTADAVKISRISWEVPSSLAADPKFQRYFNIAGQAIKDNLSKELLTINNVVTHNMVKLTLTIDSRGQVADSDVSFSSGSKEVDKLVQSSVSDTIKYTKIPEFRTDKKFIKTDLIIFL